MKTPELRIKRTNVYVSPSAQKGWGKYGIDKSVDTLQYNDEANGWTDLPIHYENLRIYKDGIERDAY